MTCNQPLSNNALLFSFGERQNQKALTKFSVFEDVDEYTLWPFSDQIRALR